MGDRCYPTHFNIFDKETSALMLVVNSVGLCFIMSFPFAECYYSDVTPNPISIPWNSSTHMMHLIKFEISMLLVVLGLSFVSILLASPGHWESIRCDLLGPSPTWWRAWKRRAKASLKRRRRCQVPSKRSRWTGPQVLMMNCGNLQGLEISLLTLGRTKSSRFLLNGKPLCQKRWVERVHYLCRSIRT